MIVKNELCIRMYLIHKIFNKILKTKMLNLLQYVINNIVHCKKL